MDMESIKKAKEEKDDATTAAEHTKIILHYLQTGYLDRDDAIKKYVKFNKDHPDYYIPMETSSAITGTSICIQDAPDKVIVDNLNQQLFFLTGKNLLENTR